jgi:hypothetical protein
MKYLALLLLLPGLAFAGDIAVEWDWPTTYSDDSPALPAEFADALIQVGTCTSTSTPTFGTVTRSQPVPYPGTTHTFVGLANGQYCIRGFARMVDTTRNSPASNVIAVNVTGKKIKPLVVRLKLP